MGHELRCFLGALDTSGLDIEVNNLRALAGSIAPVLYGQVGVIKDKRTKRSRLESYRIMPCSLARFMQQPRIEALRRHSCTVVALFICAPFRFVLL